MKRVPYTNRDRDPKTSKVNEPSSGETVTIMRVTINGGHRSAYRITSPNGFWVDFASRLDAVNYTIQNGWRLTAALDRVAS
jgi:hypothetical protein